MASHEGESTLLADLAKRLRARIGEISGLGIEGADGISIRPVLNRGGFVNRSFTVRSPGGAYHAKLASDPDGICGLRRWLRLNERLSERYRAPRVRAWIDLPGTPFAGLVFEHIDGEPAASVADVRAAAVGAVHDLHRDDGLAAELTEMGQRVVSCAEAYESAYEERFLEDLRLVRDAPPPFVGPELLDWIGAQVELIGERIATSDAFQTPADVPTHGDLWLDNLLVSRGGELHILDWDGIGLGDPMVDWAMLFGPAPAKLAAADAELLGDLGHSAAEKERLRWYARASLLDWTLDPLADWVAAGDEPEQGGAVRSRNRRVHRRTLDAYRTTYGEN